MLIISKINRNNSQLFLQIKIALYLLKFLILMILDKAVIEININLYLNCQIKLVDNTFLKIKQERIKFVKIQNSNLKKHKKCLIIKKILIKILIIHNVKIIKNKYYKKKKSSKVFFKFYNLKNKKNLAIELQKDLSNQACLVKEEQHQYGQQKSTILKNMVMIKKWLAKKLP